VKGNRTCAWTVTDLEFFEEGRYEKPNIGRRAGRNRGEKEEGRASIIEGSWGKEGERLGV